MRPLPVLDVRRSRCRHRSRSRGRGAPSASGWRDPFVPVQAHEDAVALALHLGLRRRPEERDASIDAVELDVDRARLRRAATAADGGDALDVAAAQVGGHPEVRHAAA